MLNKVVKYYPIFYETLPYFFSFSIFPTRDMPQIAKVLVCTFLTLQITSYLQSKSTLAPNNAPHFSFIVLSGPDALQYLKATEQLLGTRDRKNIH